MLAFRRATDADLPKIAQLISTVWQVNGSNAEMHVGDLYWSLFCARPAIRERRPQIWIEDGNLIAFSMLSPNHWLDFVIQPGFDALVILPAALESARKSCGDERMRVGRRIEDPATVSWLESAGYHRMKFGYPTLEHTLESCIRHESLVGFSVKSLAESPITPAARSVAWNATFLNDVRDANDIESLSLAPGYRADLDFVCVDDSGEVGAFCTVWYDEQSRSGLFEPVGTAANFQRQGLATAIMKHALIRLREWELNGHMCVFIARTSQQLRFMHRSVFVGFRVRLGLNRSSNRSQSLLCCSA